jgi:hypothetical protein
MTSPTRLGPPASGAYIAIPVTMDDIANNEVVTVEVALPAGMTITVVGVSYYAAAVTSDPALIVGTHADDDGILTALNLSADAVAFAVCNGALAVNSRVDIAASGNVKVTVTADAGDAAEGVCVTIWGYVTEHANNIPDV